MAEARCSCGSDCSDWCTSCYGKSNCMWDCSSCGGCDGTCSGGCQGDCKGECNTTCTGGCTGACNKGCDNTESASLASVTLSEKFEAANITDIARLIYLEAQRRGNSPESTTFTSGKVINASDIAILISNLSLAGQTASYSAVAGNIGLKELGQDLIDKAIAAYNTTVAIS